MEFSGGAGGQRRDGFPGFGGPRVDLVVHVGEVPDVGDVGIEVAQQAHHHVECREGADIAEMRQVIDRGAADIDADMGRISGGKELPAAGLAVVEVEIGHLGFAARGLAPQA